MTAAETIITLLFIYVMGGLLFFMLHMMISDMWFGRDCDSDKNWAITIFWPISLVCYLSLGLVMIGKFLFTKAPKAFWQFLVDDIYHHIFPKKEVNVEED